MPTRRRILRVPPLWLLAAAGACAQTLPLPAGAGFDWERVGDTPHVVGSEMTVDAGGTLWLSNTLQWLDTRGGAPGVWVVPAGPPPRPFGNAILTLGPHPDGGPPRADTVLVAIGGVYRSVDGGHHWDTGQGEFADRALIELPAWHPFAGRLLVGNAPAFSDDRGDSWSEPRYTADELDFAIRAFLVLPPPELLPGAASGRPVTVPADWPSGRVVGVGSGGVAVLSDDGGDSYYAANLLAPGRHAKNVALVRRPDAHPLGPGPRLIAAGTGESTSPSVWTSDDAGVTWVRRAFLPEPVTGPGAPNVEGVHALSEPGEADPGAGGRALVVLGLGHLYQTTDAGTSWSVVGRAPEMNPPSDTLAATLVEATAIGPDGRLYVSVSRLGPSRAWLWRTASPFAVASSGVPVPPSPGLRLSVRPNPSPDGAVVTVSLAEAAAVRVVVVDMLGREVAELHAGPLAAGDWSWRADTRAWPVGLYVVRVTAGSQTEAARFTVAR